MRLERLSTLGVRNLAGGEVELGADITLLWGPNGAGKTSLLEAICLALTARSPRTSREREVISFSASLARAEATVGGAGGSRTFLWSLSRDGERRYLVDGAPAAPGAAGERPGLVVFLPDRLALVKGPPAIRRQRLDRLVAALWPARAAARRRYGEALAQRNALLARLWASRAPELDAWDRELALRASELMAARAAACELLAPEFADAAAELGLEPAVLEYRPRCAEREPDALVTALAERRPADLARGFTTHGPHLDEVRLTRGGRELRRYGSQGEQRTAVLALAFAERRALAGAGRALPLLLLDDVMSELDGERRALLAGRLGEGGQAVVTATDPGQLPGELPRAELAVRDGAVLRRLAGEAAAGSEAA